MNQTRRGFMGLLAAIAAAPAALAANKKFTPVSMTWESRSFNRAKPTTLGGTAGKILMSDGKGGVSWEDPVNSRSYRKLTQNSVSGANVSPSTKLFVLDEAGFLQDGKPVYVATPFGRGT